MSSFDKRNKVRRYCSHCGELGTRQRPVRETELAPPCDGFAAVTVHVHADCARDIASASTR